MMIKTIFMILLISLSHPVRSARKFSFGKIKTLKRALKYESPGRIIANFQRYLGEGGDNEQSVPDRAVDLPSLKEEFLHDRMKRFHEFLRSGSTLVFPEGEPVLSIITVFFNQVALSYACLRAIIQYVTVPYEVIIVDNHSTDGTGLLFDRISGATIIRNKENLHFLKANNQAFEHVRGAYILFLNNDAEIGESTISSAIHTLTGNKRCGAVGGKLILPNGALQEAGSIIWNDGSCLGYGRNDNPRLPEYNFKRVTDYCSGAFLLTHTRLFRDFGGFDERFQPAYYEETDYCLWLQEKGWEVVYDPGAAALHVEFGSGVSDEAIALQQENRRIFYEKHRTQLAEHFEPHPANLLSARFAASWRRKKKALYIDDRVPHCDLGAGFPRSNTIVRIIKELGFCLTVYPLMFPDEDTEGTACRDVDPYIEIAYGYGLDGFGRFIGLREDYFDIIWVSRPHNMEAISKYINGTDRRWKIVYDVEAIFTDREIMKKELGGEHISREKKDALYEDERKLSHIADTIVAVSPDDALKFIDFGNRDVQVLGHTLEIREPVPGFDSRNGLLFVGNLDDDASPNVDSVVWFVSEIFPLIREEAPDMTIDIVGSAKASRMARINEKGVFIHGRVTSVDNFYNKCRVFVAPTRFAAGIPFKVHEAASFGLPVVATQLLCDQLRWHQRRELLAARVDKRDFADKVMELYYDKGLWTSLREHARKSILDEMSLHAYKQKIAHILRSPC